MAGAVQQLAAVDSWVAAPSAEVAAVGGAPGEAVSLAVAAVAGGEVADVG